jgi:hypothetical protein
MAPQVHLSYSSTSISQKVTELRKILYRLTIKKAGIAPKKIAIPATS